MLAAEGKEKVAGLGQARVDNPALEARCGVRAACDEQAAERIPNVSHR
jgi:hypothetical protein